MNNSSGKSMLKSGSSLHVLHRDPADIRAINALLQIGLSLVLLLVTSIGINIYQYWRRPDRIVVDRSNGRVLVLNDRVYGETEAVQFGPDKLTDADKIYITTEFAKSIFQIDPATRNKDVERGLRMMVPNSALKFAQYLKQTGILDKQRNESWQAVWTSQDVSVDKADPYTVRVIGKQDTTKILSNSAYQETRQINLTLKLVADPLRRSDRNLRSGFLISRFDEKEIGTAAAQSNNNTSQFVKAN